MPSRPLPSMPDFRACQLAVAGDVMLDRYWSGSTTRISPEAPVPIVNVKRIEHRAGGAANVALGLRALGAAVSLAGEVGDDEAGQVLTQSLEGAGVQCRFQRGGNRATIVKLRVISQHQQMIRLDFEQAPAAGSGLQVADVAPLLSPCQALVLSDYGKGALAHVGALIAAARDAGKPVLVDPKQVDFSVYAGASILTPNRLEFERAVGPCANDAELVERGHRLIESLRLDALLVTRGEEGMSLLALDGPPLHIPARAQEVYDVTGAGDTVIAVLAAAVAAGQPWREAAELANAAAAIAVGKLGTATVTAQELAQALARAA